MGFQIQEDLRTVELEIINALYKVTNQNVKIYPSGRTDRYVHAIGQVIHFDLDKEIPSLGLKKAMNSYLPADIYFKSVELVNMDFHSRFSAKSKEYRYYIDEKYYTVEDYIGLMKEAIPKNYYYKLLIIGEGNKVIDQAPSAGTLVKEGGTVIIYLGN